MIGIGLKISDLDYAASHRAIANQHSLFENAFNNLANLHDHLADIETVGKLRAFEYAWLEKGSRSTTNGLSSPSSNADTL